MAVWSYTPQEVMTETLLTGTRVNEVSPTMDVMGSDSKTMIRGWRLRYTLVDSVTVNSMRAFFQTQAGPWLAFQFFNPNDRSLHSARFDSGMSIDLFQPGLHRMTEISLRAVVNS